MHYSKEKPSFSTFRVITTNFLGVRIFRKFTATSFTIQAQNETSKWWVSKKKNPLRLFGVHKLKIWSLGISVWHHSVSLCNAAQLHFTCDLIFDPHLTTSQRILFMEYPHLTTNQRILFMEYPHLTTSQRILFMEYSHLTTSQRILFMEYPHLTTNQRILFMEYWYFKSPKNWKQVVQTHSLKEQSDCLPH